MTTPSYFLASSQYETEAIKWLQAVGRGESVSVIFFPKTDRFVRLGYLLNDQALIARAIGVKQAKQTILQRIIFEAHDVEELEDLLQLIAAQVNSSKHFSKNFSFDQLVKHLDTEKLTLILIVPDAEKFLTPEGKTVLTHLSYLAEERVERIRIISFFEKNITHPSLLPILPSSSHLYENVFRYPLYSEEQTKDFVQRLREFWNVHVAKSDEDRIVKACGGHFWLVKEAVRSITSSGSWTPDEAGTLFRLQTIYSLLLPSEQEVIQKIVSRKKPFSSDEEASQTHLLQMNVIDRKKKLKVAIFSQYLKHQADFNGELSVYGDRLILNQIPIDSIFSRKERRIVRLLVQKKNDIVSRDELAGCIWPANTHEHYSDWAIDQTIARIRKRFAELSIPPRVIASVRGKGYRIRIA